MSRGLKVPGAFTLHVCIWHSSPHGPHGKPTLGVLPLMRHTASPGFTVTLITRPLRGPPGESLPTRRPQRGPWQHRLS